MKPMNFSLSDLTTPLLDNILSYLPAYAFTSRNTLLAVSKRFNPKFTLVNRQPLQLKKTNSLQDVINACKTPEDALNILSNDSLVQQLPYESLLKVAVVHPKILEELKLRYPATLDILNGIQPTISIPRKPYILRKKRPLLPSPAEGVALINKLFRHFANPDSKKLLEGLTSDLPEIAKNTIQQFTFLKRLLALPNNWRNVPFEQIDSLANAANFDPELSASLLRKLLSPTEGIEMTTGHLEELSLHWDVFRQEVFNRPALLKQIIDDSTSYKGLGLVVFFQHCTGKQQLQLLQTRNVRSALVKNIASICTEHTYSFAVTKQILESVIKLKSVARSNVFELMLPFPELQLQTQGCSDEWKTIIDKHPATFKIMENRMAVYTLIKRVAKELKDKSSFTSNADEENNKNMHSSMANEPAHDDKQPLIDFDAITRNHPLKPYFQKLHARCAQGSTDAYEWHELGKFYKHGIAMDEPDFNEAFNCFAKACKLMPDFAQKWYDLGYCYQAGWDNTTKSCKEEAINCYRNAVAAAPHYAKPWQRMSELYFYGWGKTKPNYALAFECLSHTVEADPTDSHSWQKLASCYQNGFGTERNLAKAQECEERANRLSKISEKPAIKSKESSVSSTVVAPPTHIEPPDALAAADPSRVSSKRPLTR